MHVFSQEDLEKGKKLIDAKCVISALFSGGTYQLEVLATPNSKKGLWPFLQLSDEGEVIDAFCTCEEAENGGGCAHLAAAWIKVGGKEPLHVRFRSSLWNHLGRLFSERYGYESSALSKTKEGFEGKPGLLIQANKKALNKLEEMLYHRPVETEETSLKFSNLSQEELLHWREGRPSDNLRFELSFWSDFSKWLMAMQEDGVKYSISFSSEALPQSMRVEFPDLTLDCQIEKEDWEELIPTLQTVKSPLKVSPYGNGNLEEILFDRKSGMFSLKFSSKEKDKVPQIPEKGVSIGEWVFTPGVGFSPRKGDPLFSKSHIEKEQVNVFFARHLALVQKKLKGETIHTSPASLKHILHLDSGGTLHIDAYLFEEGDLVKEHSHCFGQWVYIADKGFYQVEERVFEGKSLEVPKEKMSDFISKHRVWLQGIDGFQTHVSGMESHLGYRFDEEGKLAFFTRHEFSEAAEKIVDLGDWIYVGGRGFYAKVTARVGAKIKAGARIEPYEISHFIDEHKEELEPIPGFFSSSCPLEKSGLNISFNEEKRIQIHPEFFFKQGYHPERVSIYGDYTYVEGEGFALIPHESRLPETYKVEKVIDRMAEGYFVAYELELLYPHVLKIDPRLQKPKQIQLQLLHIKRQPQAKTGQWVLELNYQTDIGTVRPYEIWEAFGQGKQYLFSDAGLLFFRKKRFDWIKLKNSKKWLEKGDSIRLDTLEFLRLCGIEELSPPMGTSKRERDARKLFLDFIHFKAPTECDLTGLKSHLRSYQKTGVGWLWFLYSYGLSGLLCDEMGLGKTHQAMGLIAAIQNAKKGKAKFLVVCPTSVIYHWEKLIQQFLPMIKPYIFHGIGRNFDAFASDSHDLLLTSYGIVRTENKALSNISFDLAVYDELQIAKNEKSMTHKALRNIHGGMRLGLTGTPIENHLMELKALFDLVIPNYLPSASSFREFFIAPIEKYQDEEKRHLLHRIIRPFLLRRKKSEVLTELPEKIEEIALCDLSEEQYKMYRDIVDANRVALLAQLRDEAMPPPIAHIFSMLTKLKQVCNHPCLIGKNPAKYKEHQSGKWDLFVELLDETFDSGQKVVVFTQYLAMLDIFGMYLKEKEIGFAEIRGSTKNRKEEVERFASDPNCKVFLGSLQAAGVGIDLISASVVIHYDRWWNPAKENQATDRVHRMGQKRGVQVFKLVTKNTIEEHIDRLIERKLSLAKGVIGFDDQDQIKGLSRKELIELLTLLD